MIVTDDDFEIFTFTSKRYSTIAEELNYFQCGLKVLTVMIGLKIL